MDDLCGICFNCGEKGEGVVDIYDPRIDKLPFWSILSLCENCSSGVIPKEYTVCEGCRKLFIISPLEDGNLSLFIKDGNPYCQVCGLKLIKPLLFSEVVKFVLHDLTMDIGSYFPRINSLPDTEVKEVITILENDTVKMVNERHNLMDRYSNQGQYYVLITAYTIEKIEVSIYTKEEIEEKGWLNGTNKHILIRQEC